jgi:hypothetical protein
MKLSLYTPALSLLLVASLRLNAAGTVDFLEVNNDLVLFSTTEIKATASPACVTSDNADLWSVSLATKAGSAIYSMILTAMANGESMGLVVQSANDCNVRDGIERADTVRTFFQHSAKSAGGYSIGLYKFGGLERIGTFIKMDRSTIHYMDQKGGIGHKMPRYDVKSYARVKFYFSDINCQGTVWTSLGSRVPLFSDYRADHTFFTAKIAHTYTSYQSHTTKKQCINEKGRPLYLYEIDATAPTPVHALCGEGPCIVKEDS